MNWVHEYLEQDFHDKLFYANSPPSVRSFHLISTIKQKNFAQATLKKRVNFLSRLSRNKFKDNSFNARQLTMSEKHQYHRMMFRTRIGSSKFN